MSKPTKEDSHASLLAMENRLFERWMDTMQDKSQAMFACVGGHAHHFSNYRDNAKPL
jgi:hypothetical protein